MYNSGEFDRKSVLCVQGDPVLPGWC